MSTLDEPKPCRQPSAVESQNEGSDPEAGSEENQLQGQYGWDGDNDPDNPQNWSYLKKAINIGIVFVLAFITYVAWQPWGFPILTFPQASIIFYGRTRPPALSRGLGRDS